MTARLVVCMLCGALEEVAVEAGRVFGGEVGAYLIDHSFTNGCLPVLIVGYVDNGFGQGVGVVLADEDSDVRRGYELMKATIDNRDNTRL